MSQRLGRAATEAVHTRETRRCVTLCVSIAARLAAACWAMRLISDAMARNSLSGFSPSLAALGGVLRHPAHPKRDGSG